VPQVVCENYSTPKNGFAACRQYGMEFAPWKEQHEVATARAILKMNIRR